MCGVEVSGCGLRVGEDLVPSESVCLSFIS